MLISQFDKKSSDETHVFNQIVSLLIKLPDEINSFYVMGHRLCDLCVWHIYLRRFLSFAAINMNFPFFVVFRNANEDEIRIDEIY